MDFAIIEAFVAVVERGGFTRAAEALHLSQPALSRRIGLLEGELRQPVFERDRRGARLTDAGHTFLWHAQAALACLRDGVAEVHALARGDAGTLTAAGLDGAEVVVIDSLTAQKRLVEAGFGLALVPASSAREELGFGTLRQLDVPAMRATIDVTLIHRRGAFLSPAARRLIDAVSQAPQDGSSYGARRAPKTPSHGGTEPRR